MANGASFGSFRFVEPELLWLLALPAIALLLWIWRLSHYRRDAGHFHFNVLAPNGGSPSIFGGLLFWLATITASALVIVALSHPSIVSSTMATSGVDLIVLQDGSASMSVTDVAGSRWQRSMRFLRVLANSLRWNNDRIALAVFAHIAAPQVRLTKDPNTFYFFLDHLEQQSPFRLEDDTTWDTNIELGIHWGTRLFEKDRALKAGSSNAPAFVLITDGQAWSGKVDDAIKVAQSRRVQMYVVGVGTASGGTIPAPSGPSREGAEPYRPIHSSLDRNSLLTIARAANGSYFELDRESDSDIATQIIRSTRRQVYAPSATQAIQELYWPVLIAAAGIMALGMLTVQNRSELLINTIVGTTAALVLWFIVK